MIKGLIGERLNYSYSCLIHKQIIDSCKLDYSYDKIELDENKMIDFINEKKFDFINVTIPYKQKVIKYLDIIDEKATKINTINTIVNRNGVLFGYNTDYDGFLFLLKRNNISVENKRCLILGTGGTSNTVFTVLNDEGAKSINKASRSKTKDCLSYEEIYNYEFDIIINTTPVGTSPDYNNCIIDIKKFKNIDAVVDVIYNPNRTKLIQEAQMNNINCVNGLDMLIYQAIKAEEIYLETTIDETIFDFIKSTLMSNNLNIVLIGLPGSGKSTIGNVLGNEISRRIIDIDYEIEKNEKMSINEIFANFGEEYFRKLENKCVYESSLLNNTIICTGGGVIKNYENIVNLKANGIIIWLRRDINKIAINNSRPLTRSIGELQNLLIERNAFYKKYCDYIVQNDELIKDTIKDIVEYFNSYILWKRG